MLRSAPLPPYPAGRESDIPPLYRRSASGDEESVIEDGSRRSSPNNFPNQHLQNNAPVLVQMSHYPFRNQWSEALSLSSDLQDLKKRCKNASLEWKHYGELLCGLRHLLELCRQLGVISLEEHIKETKTIVSAADHIFTFAAGPEVPRDNLLDRAWRDSNRLLIELDSKLSKGHLSMELSNLHNNLSELRELRNVATQ